MDLGYGVRKSFVKGVIVAYTAVAVSGLAAKTWQKSQKPFEINAEVESTVPYNFQNELFSNSQGYEIVADGRVIRIPSELLHEKPEKGDTLDLVVKKTLPWANQLEAVEVRE